MSPPRKPDDNEGYFEYIEGPVGVGTMTNGTNVYPVNPATNSDLSPQDRDTTAGDFDDILLFTTRSKGRPFVGRLGNTTIQSDVAEVAWFVRGRTLYRRVLLVAPGVLTSPLNANQNGVLEPGPTELAIPASYGSFYAGYDLSVHPSWDAAGNFLGYVPNTLGDLTRRECRYAHACAANDTFPYDVSRWFWTCSLPPGYQLSGSGTVTRINIPTLPTLKESSSASKSPPTGWPASFASYGWVAGATQPPGTAASTTAPTLVNATTNPNGLLDMWGNNPAYRPADNAMSGALGMSDGTRVADDVILTNVIGFDVKAWDPQAIVIQRTKTADNSVSLLLPGDTEYYEGYKYYGGSNGGFSYSFASQGAYVDIGNPWVGKAGYTGGVFSGSGNMVGCYGPLATLAGAYLPGVYDTWSTHYEDVGTQLGGGDTRAGRANNGFDDLIEQYSDPILGCTVPQQAANGVVDDDAEKLTHPPYPSPLRGIQVKIRVFEPDSRQVREVTVVQDFVSQ
jgi:hypothetical protein